MSPIILREVVKIGKFSHVNERDIEELPDSVIDLRASSTLPDPQNGIDPQEHQLYFESLPVALKNCSVIPYMVFETEIPGAWGFKRLNAIYDNLRQVCQGQDVVRLAYLSHNYTKNDLSVLVEVVPELARETIR